MDIKPGSNPNPVDLKSKGKLPVAVVTTGDCDAADVAPSTVTIGNDDGSDTPVAARNKGDLMASLGDVDGHGDLDLHFETQALVGSGDLDADSTELVLNGATFGGQVVQGSDAVRIVPAN